MAKIHSTTTPVDLPHKIKQSLEETRIVLPGTQAILGFQLTSVFATGFEKLSSLLQIIHFASILSLMFCMICLLMPVAYHKIAEEGKTTENFYLFLSAMIIIGMVFLALGITVDIFVITDVILKSTLIALVTSVITGILFFTAWFGYTIIRRKV